MNNFMTKKVVVVDFLRTPISRAAPTKPEKDVFSGIRMDECAAELIKELIRKNDLKPAEVDRCIIGCANQQKEQWLYGGRAVSLLADLPYETAALAMDIQCGSSMGAVQAGAMEIALGYSDLIFAGGLEHLTRIPMRSGTLPNPKLLQKKGFDPSRIGKTLNDMYDSATERYLLPGMGDTAELLAAESGITREEMDKWSEKSHHRAGKAIEEGFFKGEILPVEVEGSDGSKNVIERDQSVRPDTTYEKIASLPPAFRKDGLITAGNSSPLNSGASMVVLMSEEKAREYGLTPLATVESIGWGGVDPLLMGKGPTPASRMALEKAGLKVEDIDFWEINEAFAVVALWNIKELGIDPEKVNVKGGAIALGHPLGMTGARLVGTLARILQTEEKTYGLASACIGGGQGVATIIKKV